MNAANIAQLQQMVQQLIQAETRHAQQLQQLAQEESRASNQLQTVINQIGQMAGIMGQAYPATFAGTTYQQQPTQFGSAQFNAGQTSTKFGVQPGANQGAQFFPQAEQQLKQS